MSARTLAVLALVAVLAALAVSGVQRRAAPQQDVGALLAPGLSEALDQIQQVRLIGAGNTVLMRLEPADGEWQLQEQHGYRIEPARLRELLHDMARARCIEAKTAQPERHARLGVEDVASMQARGVRIEIQAPARQWSIVLGDALARGQGRYARRSGEDQSWLLDRSLKLERDPLQWLAREVLDIGSDRVVAVEVQPRQGEAIKLRRIDSGKEADSDFELENLPAGRHPGAGFSRQALAGALSGLNFEAVSRAAEWPPDQIEREARFQLDDGRRIRLQLWRRDEQSWVQVDQDLKVSDDAAHHLQAEVEGFNRRHAGWVYRLPAHKAANLGKSLQDYLQTQEDTP